MQAGPSLLTALCVETIRWHADCILDFSDIQAYMLNLREHETGLVAVAMAIWAIRTGIVLSIVVTPCSDN